MKFRYDIGYLRGIAVLAVFFYHFRIPFFDGGFIGVDIFFVISGFLMTKIIFSSYENGKFSYLDFIRKRIVRIVPPLIVVSLFILLISIFFFFENQLIENIKQIIASLTFTSNFYYYFNQDYFATTAQYNIFLHSWSLSVEWQFYLLFPVFIIILKTIFKDNARQLLFSYLGITIISFLLCIYASNGYKTINFYMFPTRAWEMLLGGILIFFEKESGKIPVVLKNFLFLISTAILITSIMYLNEETTWPSIYTVIPTFATAGIIFLNVEPKFLKNKIIQYCGNISYSLYLWHWPIFVLIHSYNLTDTNYKIIGLLVSIIFAILSYEFIERKRRLSKLPVLGLSYVTVLIFSFAAIFLANNNSLENIRFIDNKFKNLLVYDIENHFKSNGCFITITSEEKVYDYQNCLKIIPEKQNILLIGDSHAAQYSKSIRKKLSPNQNLLEVSAGFTFPFVPTKGEPQPAELMEKTLTEFIPKNAENIDLILISIHLPMRNYLNYTEEELVQNLKELASKLASLNLNFYFIGQTESYSVDYGRICLGKEISDQVIEEKYVDKETEELKELMKGAIPKDRYIDLYDLNGLKKLDQSTNTPYMFDSNHLTELGADQIIDLLKSRKIL
ncbi:acyltransferase family protein [Sphingobacterium lactis]|uniref:Peptidoglycan/LPS O-acetylase OafA/YrhL, contains acyltransferase and SGNH-hydrolase domains n=1 Tax=Sphingobacterium lactis TaxID=797291 RepID=A0A1H6C932_9SPHI|nr:acyltransferase family protein [Sphingobacterium lactis]SEG69484.1 Peptidoglycan/LPS O-acetylase OafA/YrhL, contains acyltransferase and SGNH-hydrolase domains [Sphingobacterium lactis]